MKTLKYLLATMLLLGVCNLTHSQKAIPRNLPRAPRGNYLQPDIRAAPWIRPTRHK